jgi:hypothetical protein
VSLKGKPLIEAIDLLKNAGDLVTLKISRKIAPQQQSKMHQASPMKQPPPEPHQQLPYHYHHQYHHPESNSTPQKYLNPNRSLNETTAQQQQQSPQQQMHIKNMPPMGRTVTNSYESNAEKINGSTPYGYHQQHQQQSFSTNGIGAGFNNGSRGGGISAASSVAEKPNDNSDFINSEYQKSLQYCKSSQNCRTFYIINNLNCLISGSQRTFLIKHKTFIMNLKTFKIEKFYDSLF